MVPLFGVAFVNPRERNPRNTNANAKKRPAVTKEIVCVRSKRTSAMLVPSNSRTAFVLVMGRYLVRVLGLLLLCPSIPAECGTSV